MTTYHYCVSYRLTPFDETTINDGFITGNWDLGDPVHQGELRAALARHLRVPKNAVSILSLTVVKT